MINILRIALPVPLRRCFDYLPPSDYTGPFLPGMRVKVPFGARQMLGMLIETADHSSVPANKLKRATEVVDAAPVLPEDIFKLCAWAADYYHASLGEVLWSAMPSFLRKAKPNDIVASPVAFTERSHPTLTLNADQQRAVDALIASLNTFQVHLLDGVTGSGKTEVYLRTIEQCLQRGQQVLVLVPEISLTPQTIARFQQRFAAPIVALHSGLTDKQRDAAWLEARDGSAKIVIGTRSAVFTPFQHLGLIILDEEHDTSFKQHERFRYHARDLAIVRARNLNIPVLLGSATPSLETINNAELGRYHYLSLPQRAGNAKPPAFQIIDIRKQRLDQGLSEPLLTAMRQHLLANQQVMLFLNRRGFAPVWMCRSCGDVVNCKRCDTRMIYHKTSARLHCHRCDGQRELPQQCSECQAQDFAAVGLGTQRIEAALQKHFPNTPILRIDRDSTRRKGAMHDMLEQIHDGQAKILIGTQMLAKGHHFPQVTLVGVIDADSGLLSADFRALERTGQLLIQVAGRAGRADKPGTVYVQTHHPDHPLLTELIQHGYTHFAKHLLHERKQATLPPFSYHALFRAEAHDAKIAEDFLADIKTSCPSIHTIQLHGPLPAIIVRTAGMFRMHLLVQAKQRRDLQQFLKEILPGVEKLANAQRVRWALDIDPLEAF